MVNSVLASAPVKAGVPRFKAKSTYCWRDRTDKHHGHSRRCTDIVLYPYDEESTDPYAILKQKSEGARKEHMENEARTSWLWASLILEAKSKAFDSPFDVPKAKQEAQLQNEPAPPQSTSMMPNSLHPSHAASAAPASTTPSPAVAASSNNTDETFLRLHTYGGAQTMGQMAEYVARVLEKQFILSFFTVFICENHAWILRWDRAGVVVSEPFNFFEHPLLLHRFIYRFACLDDAQRGRDPTVNFATDQEVQLVRSFEGRLTPWQQDQYKAAFFSDYPVYRIDVPQDDVITTADLKAGRKVPREELNLSGERTHRFLVGTPYFMGDSVVGRGTRGHIAYDIWDRRLVFCKEYWRLDVPSHHPEGDTLMELHSKGAPYIATPIVAGDVRSGGRVHCTHSQAFRPHLGAKYIQYRVIFAEVAEPLQNYVTSYELVGVMCEALIGSLRYSIINSILMRRYCSTRARMEGGRDLAPRHQRAQHSYLSILRCHWRADVQGVIDRLGIVQTCGGITEHGFRVHSFCM